MPSCLWKTYDFGDNRPCFPSVPFLLPARHQGIDSSMPLWGNAADARQESGTIWIIPSHPRFYPDEIHRFHRSKSSACTSFPDFNPQARAKV
jgi:hypothetical protein